MTDNNDSFSNANNAGGNGQFVISYELLALLQWLIEHDADKLKKIIARALVSGLREEIQRPEDGTASSMHPMEDAQYSIVEFFGLLESLMLEAVNEQSLNNVLERNLMPAIDHIDSTVCDDATLRFSIEKTTTRLKKSPEENAQETLFKELLKRWKPSNKKMLN